MEPANANKLKENEAAALQRARGDCGLLGDLIHQQQQLRPHSGSPSFFSYTLRSCCPRLSPHLVSPCRHALCPCLLSAALLLLSLESLLVPTDWPCLRPHAPPAPSAARAARRHAPQAYLACAGSPWPPPPPPAARTHAARPTTAPLCARQTGRTPLLFSSLYASSLRAAGLQAGGSRHPPAASALARQRPYRQAEAPLHGCCSVFLCCVLLCASGHKQS